MAAQELILGLGWVLDGVAALYPWLIEIRGMLEAVLSNQDTINAYVARISAAVTSVGAEVQGLKDQVAAGASPEKLDFSGLETAVQAFEGLEPPTVSDAPAAAPVSVASANAPAS